MMLRYEPALLIVWTMATAALSFADLEHPIRTVFALTFLGFVPGLAIIRLARLEGIGIRVLLALPTSLAMAAVVSGVLVYSGVASWDLGLSVLVAVTVGAVALDLARPTLLVERTAPRRKLDDESRQAELIQALLDGGTLSEAAQAADVSMATLRRALGRSNRLRMAVIVATHWHSETSELTSDDLGEFDGERPTRR